MCKKQKRDIYNLLFDKSIFSVYDVVQLFEEIIFYSILLHLPGSMHINRSEVSSLCMVLA